jgi:hypothetical protein
VRYNGVRSGGGGAADWMKEMAAFGLSEPVIGPQAKSCWAGTMKIKGKRFRATKGLNDELKGKPAKLAFEFDSRIWI